VLYPSFLVFEFPEKQLNFFSLKRRYKAGRIIDTQINIVFKNKFILSLKVHANEL
jgi:hypothetical protein